MKWLVSFLSYEFIKLRGDQKNDFSSMLVNSPIVDQSEARPYHNLPINSLQVYFFRFDPWSIY